MLKKYILVLLISMIPIIELRGAIPYAVGFGLPLIPSYVVAIIGNILPVPIIFLFARKVLIWGSNKKYTRKVFNFFLKKGEKGGEKLKRNNSKSIYIALLLFVGIPLPGTGAWTGTLIASFLDLDFKKSIFAVSLGVVLAGIIMIILSLGVFKGLLA